LPGLPGPEVLGAFQPLAPLLAVLFIVFLMLLANEGNAPVYTIISGVALWAFMEAGWLPNYPYVPGIILAMGVAGLIVERKRG